MTPWATFSDGKMFGDTIIVGFAMFTVYFGMGNLISARCGFDTGAV